LITTIGRMWELCKNKILVIDKNMYLVLDEGDKLFANKD
jgi:superfamily II DNA/RNA helicase